MPTEWGFHVRIVIAVFSLLLAMAAPAMAQLGISFGMPGLSIGVNVPVYPQLVRVPGYPVYYAPGLQTNFFFYDGLYWVYQDDDWYASDWYDGPWGQVSAEAVPLFVLRVPVRYYRNPPTYFRDWRADAPPRWGEHWGNDWQQRRPGWDRWNRNAVPAPAPLPHYQRAYVAERYPRPEHQHELRERNYRYQPREAVARQHLQVQPAAQAPAWQQRHEPRDRWAAPQPAPPPERQRERRSERWPEPQSPQAPRGSAEQRPRQPAAPVVVVSPPRHPEAERGRQSNSVQQHPQGRKEEGKGRGERDDRDDRGNSGNRDDRGKRDERDSDRKK